MCRPKDQTEPEYLFEISLLPSCESTFSNLYTNILRFGGVVNTNNRNKKYVNKCFTWRQWWQSNNRFVEKRDLLKVSPPSNKNKRNGVRSNFGGGGGVKREALHVNDRPRPGFDYVDEEDDNGNDTTHDSLSANNSNNLTSINNGSEIVMNGTANEGV